MLPATLNVNFTRNGRFGLSLSRPGLVEVPPLKDSRYATVSVPAPLIGLKFASPAYVNVIGYGVADAASAPVAKREEKLPPALITPPWAKPFSAMETVSPAGAVIRP